MLAQRQACVPSLLAPLMFSSSLSVVPRCASSCGGSSHSPRRTLICRFSALQKPLSRAACASSRLFCKWSELTRCRQHCVVLTVCQQLVPYQTPLVRSHSRIICGLLALGISWLQDAGYSAEVAQGRRQEHSACGFHFQLFSRKCIGQQVSKLCVPQSLCVGVLKTETCTTAGEQQGTSAPSHIL